MNKLLHALGTMAAGVWLGAMILIAVVAQTTFQTARTLGIASPDALAGKIMAANFTRYDKVQGICAAVLVVTQIVAPILRLRFSPRDRFRLCAIFAACIFFVYGAMVLTPQIQQLQGPIDSSGVDDAIRATFDQFHKSAVMLSKINLVILALIVLEMAWPGAGAERVRTQIIRNDGFGPKITEI